MGFSITSAVFGGIIIIVYSIGIARFRWYYDDYYYNEYDYDPTAAYGSLSYRSRGYRYDTQMALMALILILGIVEFAIGIWAAVCLCLLKPCTCCYDTPSQQVRTLAPEGRTWSIVVLKVPYYATNDTCSTRERLKLKF